MTLQACRAVLDEFRVGYQPGQAMPAEADFLQQAGYLLEQWFEPTLRPVINATGVILHTNLGRAPLSREACDAALQAMQGYNTLEFNLHTGKRGSRMVHCEDLLKRISGAEAAMVVNNNAAAVLLALSALARRRRVIISRTQLVEIGGGFRVPDVMAQSGARLVEVGTTNRVHLSDYEQALQEPAALVMRAHSSNFRIIGFTTEPSLAEMVQTAHRHGVMVLDDLGSGALLNTSTYGLAKEPTVQESVAAGADVVCFSGDKLIGGPQAGIIVGRKECLDRLRKHPLARAVRIDKISLAALAATLMHYVKGEAEQKVPIWKMISAAKTEMLQRTESLRAGLGTGSVVESLSTVGGGSLPEETLPGYALELRVRHPDRFLAHLRSGERPVIARIEEERVLFDLRTVFADDEPALVQTIQTALNRDEVNR